MKEIKAFIHSHRTAAVIQALRDSSFFNALPTGTAGPSITISQVQCIGTTSDASQQHYSVELAEPVTLQTRLELACSDEVADAVVDLIVRTGRTGQSCSGWVHAQALEKRVPIE